MKHRLASLLAVSLSYLLISPVHAETDAGLQAIVELSQVNGQALACQDTQAAARAKDLMLRHAPKTARFGSAFDDGTQQAYLAQTHSSAPCPSEAALTVQLVALALRLQTSLPATSATTSNITTTTQ